MRPVRQRPLSAKSLEKFRRRALGRAEARHRLVTTYRPLREGFHAWASWLMRVHTWPTFGENTIRAYLLRYDRPDYRRHIEGLRTNNGMLRRDKVHV